MTTNQNQDEVTRMVEQGKQMSAGLVSGGEMWIEDDPARGMLRVKLRGIQPAESRAQLTQMVSWVLVNCGTMLNLQVKQHTEQTGGK